MQFLHPWSIEQVGYAAQAVAYSCTFLGMYVMKRSPFWGLTISAADTIPWCVAGYCAHMYSLIIFDTLLLGLTLRAIHGQLSHVRQGRKPCGCDHPPANILLTPA